MKSQSKRGFFKSFKKLLGFICEAGLLKRTMRCGWSVVGIKNAESVAEHSFRCAVIGYILAHLEKASVEEVLSMTLFNDIEEARIGDLHKMAQKYIDARAAEDKAYFEQIKSLPKGLRSELKSVRKEYRLQRSKESIIARDADILECLIQAKEYYEFGYKEAAKFMKKAPTCLKTESAKKLWQAAKISKINQWWFGLNEFKR